MLQKILFPSVTQVIVIHIPPSEVMNRLSKGIETMDENPTQKPFCGKFEKLCFEFKNKNTGRSLTIVTIGKINENSKGLLEITTAADRQEIIFSEIMLIGVSGFCVLKDYSLKGIEEWTSLGMCFIILNVIFSLIAVVSVRDLSKKHLGFIRCAIESNSGFDIKKYKHDKNKDLLILVIAMIIGLASVSLYFIFYILPIADGKRIGW